MCLQCVTDARIIKENIFPGYCLMQAVKHDEEWPKDWYGLVRIDDPDFIWEEKLIPEPQTDEDEWPLDEWDDWVSILQKLERENFAVDIRTGYLLYSACVSSGFDQGKHGSIMFYIIDTIGKAIQEFENDLQQVVETNII